MASLCRRHFFQRVSERDQLRALQGKAAWLLSQTCPKATARWYVNLRVDVNSLPPRPWAEPFCPEHSTFIRLEESPRHRRGRQVTGEPERSVKATSGTHAGRGTAQGVGAQWLVLCVAFIARVRVQSLVGVLRSHKPRGVRSVV